MRLITDPIRLIQKNVRTYLWLNLFYFGLTIVAMVAIATRPEVETSFRTWTKANFNPALMNAVSQGSLITAILLIFKNNFLYATIYAMTLPSFIIPFWGVLIGAVRSLLWGIALSPADPTFTLKFIVHIPTWFLEGQGYVIAMFAVFILWRNYFWPQRAGVEQRLAGYWVGIKQTIPLYIGVAILLGLGAVYEAIATIYLIPWVIANISSL
jgi:ABC-type xylose transport system permease subunit